MKFVTATDNPWKIIEIKKILSDLGFDIVTREDLGIDIIIDETGTTFFENARLKATAICEISGLPAIADDSGLIVDALNGEPGVYSSSFGGEALDSVERCEYLLNKMKKAEQRSAKFVCTIVCAFPNGDLLTESGECNGTITGEIRGDGRFGYDPVFIPEGYDKTMAELSLIEKNSISHRGIALKKISVSLKNYEKGTQ